MFEGQYVVLACLCHAAPHATGDLARFCSRMHLPL